MITSSPNALSIMQPLRARGGRADRGGDRELEGRIEAENRRKEGGGDRMIEGRSRGWEHETGGRAEPKRRLRVRGAGQRRRERGSRAENKRRSRVRTAEKRRRERGSNPEVFRSISLPRVACPLPYLTIVSLAKFLIKLHLQNINCQIHYNVTKY